MGQCLIDKVGFRKRECREQFVKGLSPLKSAGRGETIRRMEEGGYTNSGDRERGATKRRLIRHKYVQSGRISTNTELWQKEKTTKVCVYAKKEVRSIRSSSQSRNQRVS